jgi:hypothetical protein
VDELAGDRTLTRKRPKAHSAGDHMTVRVDGQIVQAGDLRVGVQHPGFAYLDRA